MPTRCDIFGPDAPLSTILGAVFGRSVSENRTQNQRGGATVLLADLLGEVVRFADLFDQREL